jgi:hypothetical protein
MVKKKDSGFKYLIGLLVIGMVFFANQAGYLGPKLQIPGLTVTQPPTTPPVTAYTKGIVTTDVNAYDSLNIATARIVGTDVNVYWYAYRTAWVLLGSGDAVDINVEDQDRSTIFAVASVPSGKDYYIDYAKMSMMNSRIRGVEYKDIDGDNVKEFVFRYDIADIPYASGTGKYSLPSVNAYLLTYDDSFAWPAAGKPADITGVGEAKVTKYLEWYVSLSAEKTALALSKVVLKVNTSDTSKVALKKLNIPGIGYMDGSSFTQDILSTETKWTYTISTMLLNADYIKLPVNTMNKFELTTTVEVDLATDDVLTFTLTLYYFDATESLQSTSDAVNVSE